MSSWPEELSAAPHSRGQAHQLAAGTPLPSVDLPHVWQAWPVRPSASVSVHSCAGCSFSEASLVSWFFCLWASLTRCSSRCGIGVGMIRLSGNPNLYFFELEVANPGVTQDRSK